MTSQLRRKHQTIHPARTTPIRITASGHGLLATLLLVWTFIGLGNTAVAQQAERAPKLPPLPTPAGAPPAEMPPVIAPPIENKPGPMPAVPGSAEFPYETDFTQIQALRAKEQEDPGFPQEMPGLLVLTRRDSEAEFQERIRQEKRPSGGGKVFFPEIPVVSREPLKPRQFEPSVALVQPSYVVHGRLLFEQPNFERYGWDLGILTPVANVGVYYYDLATLPYHIWSRPLDQMDTSAGKYLPGDPVSFLLYPETFSLTGLAGMAGTYVVGPFLFH